MVAYSDEDLNNGSPHDVDKSLENLSTEAFGKSLLPGFADGSLRGSRCKLFIGHARTNLAAWLESR
jgi:hypothetical protein